MDTYNDILSTDSLKDSRQIILDRDDTIRSESSGTTFPTTPILGQNCFRTDENRVYKCTQVTPSIVWTDISAFINLPSGSVGSGVYAYLDDTTTIDGYGGLLRSPDVATSEQTDSVTVNNTTSFIEGYLYNYPENRVKWDGGVWRFITWCYVDGTSPNKISEIIYGVHNVQYFDGTATFTGTDTNSRTCTLSGYEGTPFVSEDANADKTMAGYVQTAGGTFQITGYTSANVVTVAVPTGYVNESAVSYSVHKYKFQGNTGNIAAVGSANITRTVSTIAQDDIILKDLTDTIAVRYYGKTTRTTDTNIYFTHNGTEHYSYIETPLLPRLEELSTALNGIIKSTGSVISAATAGSDYSAGTASLATGILKSTTSSGELSIAAAEDFPTLNQNTTGSSASCTGNAATATTASSCSGNAATATTASACSGNSATATTATNLTAGTLTHYNEKVNALGSAGGTRTVDLTLGNVVTATVATSANTFVVTNVASTGYLEGFILKLTNGGLQTVNWMSGIKWAGGTAPTLTTSGLDILVFTTTDGGTTWNGNVVALDSK